MNHDTPAAVTVEELHALVDGQLDPARVAPVLAWLEAHPDDAVRVAHWQAQRTELRRLARTLDVGETPPAMSATVARAARRGGGGGRAPWQQAAAAALLLAVGVAAGLSWTAWEGRPGRGGGPALAGAPPAVQQFVREAGVAHAVFTAEKRHPVEVAASDEAHLVQWLTRRLGTPVKAPVLLDRGWRLLGGRLLPGDPVPRAQFMYEDGGGRRVTLYVAVFPEGQAPAETAFRSVREGARESFYWVDGRLGYALSAELPPAEVQALAREVYAQLGR